MAGILPSLLVAGLLTACEREPVARVGNPPSNAHLESLQEVEAARYEVAQRRLEQARLDALLGRAQPAAR
jgi:hypothetical protein